MNKKVLIALGVFVLLTGAVFLFMGSDSKEKEEANKTSTQSIKQEDAPTLTEDSAEQQEVTTNSSGLGYIEYSDQLLADSASSNRVLFFHAPWCSTCNFFEGQIEDQGVPQNVTILKVDYDNDETTKQKYGVTVQSTFVLLDGNGEVVESWPFARGLTSIQDLYNQI